MSARTAVVRPITPDLTTAPARGLLQRAGCGCGAKDDDDVLRRTAVQPAPTRSGVPAVVHEVLGSPGSPLSASNRAFFESRFDHDFGAVRLHSDARAAESARAVGARAYTVGTDVVLGDGTRQDGGQGNMVLAHELAHVVQQRGGTAAHGRLTVGATDSPAEREADAAASHSQTDTAAIRILAQPGAATLMRQLITPLGQGGGFRGLMERDRRSSASRSNARQRASVPAAIHGGLERISELDDADLATANTDQRLGMLEALVRTWWTGGAEERTIIRILRTVPIVHAQETLRALSERTIEGKRFLEELDRVVNFGNNLELHDALSELRLKAQGSEKGSTALTSAPVLPWHDVMGLFEDDATFSVSRAPSDKVRVKYPVRVQSSTDFAGEVRKLPFDIFISGFDYEPDQVLVIHDYDRGRFVPVVAEELAGYQAAGIRGFVGHVATVASFAVPTGAARTVFGKAAVVALERVLPATFVLVDENRLNIVKWWPNWGPQMLYFADLAKVGFSIYGVLRFGVSGWNMFKSWKQVRLARRALDSGDAGNDAESVAVALEKHADRIFDEVDRLNAGQTPFEALPEEGGLHPQVPTPAATARPPGISAGPGASGGRRTPPAPAAAVQGATHDFPFARGSELPKAQRANTVYRIMSNEEAAATFRTGKVQAARGVGGAVAPKSFAHKFFSLDSGYVALFKSAQLGQVEAMLQRAAAAERAGNGALAAQLRTQAADMVATWHAAPGQTVIVEIELKPGALEEILRRSVTEPRLDAYRGRDVFIYKVERGVSNIAVPSWQIDRFNSYVKAVQLYGWRAPFGPGQTPKGVN